MPPKPQTQQNTPDDFLAHITAAVAAKFDDLQSSLDAKYDSLSISISAHSSCLHNINLQLAKLEKNPFFTRVTVRFGINPHIDFLFLPATTSTRKLFN
ncbi:kinesin heavy chain-like protein [Corchorus capsularis]|uniref:Kinesin heavy chain-like protein n=1 Tax=Corchorus capsularis TaxID=210143 RepID=A0A1R3I4T5_COCAP|nr:kinesin heavy chain-like protein [Corchorus capsularis]